MPKKKAAKLFLSPNSVYYRTLRLAKMLVEQLAPPDETFGYQVIGVSRGGLPIALTLQGELSRLWNSPCGLALYIPSTSQYDKKHKKHKVERTWLYQRIEVDPQYHTRYIIVDDILDSGTTLSELRENEKGYATFAFLLNKRKNVADVIYEDVVDKNTWVVFPHERDESHSESELNKMLV